MKKRCSKTTTQSRSAFGCKTSRALALCAGLFLPTSVNALSTDNAATENEAPEFIELSHSWEVALQGRSTNLDGLAYNAGTIDVFVFASYFGSDGRWLGASSFVVPAGGGLRAFSVDFPLNLIDSESGQPRNITVNLKTIATVWDWMGLGWVNSSTKNPLALLKIYLAPRPRLGTPYLSPVNREDSLCRWLNWYAKTTLPPVWEDCQRDNASQAKHLEGAALDQEELSATLVESAIRQREALLSGLLADDAHR